MSVNEFLNWIIVSGGGIIAASWILERLAWFQAQTSDIKEFCLFGFAAVISIAAYLVLTYVPAEVIVAIEPYFMIIGGLFSTIIIGKAFHKVDKIS